MIIVGGFNLGVRFSMALLRRFLPHMVDNFGKGPVNV